MNYKVYIQALNNFPIADWAVSAYVGFRDNQADIYLFEDIEEVPVSPYTILVGSIENTNVFLGKLGLPPKKALNIPPELDYDWYLQRKVWITTMGEFKKDPTIPIFVKPAGRAKEFVAGVVTRMDSKQFFFNKIKDDCPVLVSEVVDIISEYRCYVIEGELKGIKHYMGDFRVFPDVPIIEQAIREYKSAPAGYSIDFGVLRNGRTVLIECNDGFSLGNYGLSDSVYVKLLSKRWLQMMKEIPVYQK